MAWWDVLCQTDGIGCIAASERGRFRPIRPQKRTNWMETSQTTLQTFEFMGTQIRQGATARIARFKMKNVFVLLFNGCWISGIKCLQEK